MSKKLRFSSVHVSNNNSPIRVPKNNGQVNSSMLIAHSQFSGSDSRASSQITKLAPGHLPYIEIYGGGNNHSSSGHNNNNNNSGSNNNNNSGSNNNNSGSNNNNSSS